MLQKTLLALALATSVFAVGCGGGSSGSSSGGSGGGGTTDSRSEVSGPLDAVQTPVSEQVIAPLADAAAGTPLEPVIACVDELVVSDTIDVLDVVANGLQDGAASADLEAALTGSAADLQAQLGDIVINLQGLIAALAGSGGCDGTGAGFSAGALDGTPLEPLGDALAPALALVEGDLDGGALSFGDLAGLYDLLNQALQSGLSQLPPEAQNAPVVGGALSLVGQALNDVGLTLDAASAALLTQDPAATAAALGTTLNNLLSGLLLDVVPINELEAAAGQDGALSDPIVQAIDTLTAALSGDVTEFDPTGLATLLEGGIGDVLAPLTDAASGSDPTVVLTELLAQITAVLDGGSTGGAVLPVTGVTELDTALAQIGELLSGAGAGGSLLEDLVGTLTGLLGL